jgi:hypothetical protein
MGVGWCSLVQICSSRRDVRMFPFEVNGQRGMPSAGIVLSKTDSPIVLLSH